MSRLRSAVPLALLGLTLAAGLPARAGGGPSKKDLRRPPSVFVDVGACPGECCEYQDWTARERVELLDRPNGKKTGVIVGEGEHVDALTGDVHVTPLRVKVRRRYSPDPELVLQRGETFYVLTNLGENHYKIWLRGEILEWSDLDFMWGGDETCWMSTAGCDAEPVGGLRAFERWEASGAVWWVKVQTKAGAIGWTREAEHFDGFDRCG